MKKLVLLSVVSLLGSIALADQCAYITKNQASKALRALSEARVVHSLCELCGETKAEKLTVKSIGLRKVDYQNFYEVVINNEGIDLAYTYVNGLNLAKIAGCATVDVSPSLDAAK